MATVLFLTKPNDARAERAADLLRRAGGEVEVHAGAWGSDLPEAAAWWRGDLIVSYMCRWILPTSLLQRAELAVNFHPAPPERRGAGGPNWALYENSSSFGVTCHEMIGKVDAGPVLAVKRFAVFPSDDVESLCERSWDALLALFYDMAGPLLSGTRPPPIKDEWSGKARTRADLDELSTIRLGMSEEDVLRRVRATSYKTFVPVMAVGDRKFRLHA